MAKTLPLIVGGVGLTGIAVGGIYLAQGTGGETSDTSSSDAKGSLTSQETKTAVTLQQQLNQPEKFWDSVEAFKKDSKESSCIRDYFGDNFTIGNNGTEIAKDKPPGGEFFKEEENQKDGRSCLIIQWKKKEKSNTDKTWNGRFTWLWTFIRGDEGFINFNVVKPSAQAKKSRFTGGFYLVGKEAGGDTWTVKYKKEITRSNAKKFEKSDWDQAFPKAHTDLKKGGNEYWDFMDSLDAVDKVCQTGTSDTCTDLKLDEKATVTKLKWTAQEEGSNALWDWSSSDDWWNKIYGVDDWKFKDNLSTIKGSWTRSE